MAGTVPTITDDLRPGFACLGVLSFAVGIAEENAIRRRARELAAQAAGTADEAGWFETLYAEAETGDAVVPWADGDTNPHLIEWATAPGRDERLAGAGRLGRGV